MHKLFWSVIFLLFISSVSCRHRANQLAVENSTEASANGSECHGNKPHLVGTEGSSLLDLGFLTVDMVRALASDRDSREVNLKDLTQLVTALAESAVLVDHPKEATITVNSKLAVNFAKLEEKVNEQLQNLSMENKQLKQKLDLYSQRAGVTAYLSTSVSSSGKNTPLKFNNIISQEGTYYDQSFGMFTCPVDGEYFVSSTLKKTSSGNTNSWSMSIKRDSSHQVAYAAEDNNRYGSSLTASVVVYCPALSKFWVEFSGSVTITGDYNVPYSSFSVYLLKPVVKD